MNDRERKETPSEAVAKEVPSETGSNFRRLTSKHSSTQINGTIQGDLKLDFHTHIHGVNTPGGFSSVGAPENVRDPGRAFLRHSLQRTEDERPYDTQFAANSDTATGTFHDSGLGDDCFESVEDCNGIATEQSNGETRQPPLTGQYSYYFVQIKYTAHQVSAVSQAPKPPSSVNSQNNNKGFIINTKPPNLKDSQNDNTGFIFNGDNITFQISVVQVGLVCLVLIVCYQRLGYVAPADTARPNAGEPNIKEPRNDNVGFTANQHATAPVELAVFLAVLTTLVCLSLACNGELHTTSSDATLPDERYHEAVLTTARDSSSSVEAASQALRGVGLSTFEGLASSSINNLVMDASDFDLDAHGLATAGPFEPFEPFEPTPDISYAHHSELDSSTLSLDNQNDEGHIIGPVQEPQLETSGLTGPTSLDPSSPDPPSPDSPPPDPPLASSYPPSPDLPSPPRKRNWLRKIGRIRKKTAEPDQNIEGATKRWKRRFVGKIWPRANRTSC
ncbi:hypothetical protein BJ508DRAFT_329958 [Ascobolus immersus RN42]|uniref:Uncharacterized protein n=1 Tax=Ascobolus immersus RN42 TaxID=1160509 RepID=A0A3N4I7B3_ASCIM|nr:hypothetical protein BJ508DRAFT_329958 [Ascobolus immersus RN42]